MVKPYQEPDSEVCLMLDKARGQGTSRDRTRGRIRDTLPAVSCQHASVATYLAD